MRSYDSWIQDPIDLEYKKFCEGEDFNPVKNAKEAVEILIEEMFEGVRFDELRASKALQFLMKHHQVDDQGFDLDRPNVVTYQSIEAVRNAYKLQIQEMKKAVSRHLNMLKYELYGEEEVHHKTVNTAITNIEWLTDESVSEKNLKVKRG